MTPTAIIAAAIRRERELAQISLSALAAKAGLAKSTLSQLEGGKGNPNVETLWALATALGIPFSSLFEAASSRPRGADPRGGRGQHRLKPIGFHRCPAG